MEQRDKKKSKPKTIVKSSEIPNQIKEIIVAKNIDGDDKKLKTNTTIPIDVGDPSLTSSINNNNIILKISQPQQNENKYSKRKVINNWDKYEEKSQNNSNNINQDNEQLVAADFQKLLDAPQSVGSHFFFNSEKQWIEEDTTISSTPLTTTTTLTTINNSNNKSNKIQNQQSSQKYFNLNLSLLIEGITSIPFYERQNYPIDLFNNDELEDMRRRSNEIKFSRKIENNNIINSVVSTTIAPSTNKLKTNEVIVKNVNDQKCDKVIIKEINKTSNDNIDQVKYVDNDEDENELDKLFDSNLNTDELPIVRNKMDSVKIINKNVNESVQVSTNIGTSILAAAEKTQPTIVKPVIGNTKEDIQQWLDDILDD